MEQTRIRKTGTGFHVSRRRLWLSLALLPAAVAWLHHFVARIRSSSAGPDKALSAAPSEPARNQLEQRLRESLVAIAEAPADPVRKLEHSRLLYEAGNWTEAIQWVDQAISQSPDDGQVLEEARLLKGRVAFLLGDYRSALEYFRRAYETSVDPAIQLRMELACIHMNDYESAAKVGRTPVSPVVSRLAERGGTKLAPLNQTFSIPLSQVDPIPGLRATVEGIEGILLLDTGGPNVSITSEFAARVGHESLIQSAGDYAGMTGARVDYGIIAEMRIGALRISDMPSTILYGLNLDGLVASGETVIGVIGAGLLEHFLVTIDYPGQKLILTPRAATEETRERHLSIIRPARAVRVPFVLAHTHFMLARGSVGARSGLTFFVDSGLVALRQVEGKNEVVQAGFSAPLSTVQELRLVQVKEDQKWPLFYEIPRMALGGAARTEQWGYLRDRNVRRLRYDGIFVDGMLSHAFLRHYVWTIDFERHEYTLSE